MNYPSYWANSLLNSIQPDPLENISTWAETHVILPQEASEPGRFRLQRTPFMKDILDDLSPLSPVREVVLMKPTQIAGTTVGLCWIGYTIHRAPANMMLVEPTLDLARKVSKQRLQPMIDVMPCLKNLVAETKSRDSENTMLEKNYPGGVLVLTGANSGIGLRFMAAKNLLLDEVDAYPRDVDNEGPPVDIVEKRLTTFSNYKVFKLSTPKTKGLSVIEPEYLDSDQRKYFVPCPECDHGQVLIWGNLTWEKDKPETARYRCEQCGYLIHEYQKGDMLSQGIWQATNPEYNERQKIKLKHGYHLNALYSPYGWRNSWAFLAHEWTKVNRESNIANLQAFINLNLAETWEEQLGEQVESSDLWNRREVYPAPVPNGVRVITAAADIQNDRIEAEAFGWGMKEEVWSIERRIFWGSPGMTETPNVWTELDEWLMQPFLRENGSGARIQCTGIDIGGGQFTKQTYDFIRPRQGRRVFALKGSSTPGANLLQTRSKNNLGGVWLWTIGTDAGKDIIFGRLKITEPGPGFIHFPALPNYDEEYFAQLCSEVKIMKRLRGVVVGYKYRQTRHRNETLDLFVYNLAAFTILNPRMDIRPPEGASSRPAPRRGVLSSGLQHD